MAKRSSKPPSPFPSKDEILAFIGNQPGKAGVREIARAFNLKNDRRAQLKQVLRMLSGDGRVASQDGKLHHPGALPSVTLADITRGLGSDAWSINRAEERTRTLAGPGGRAVTLHDAVVQATRHR